MEFSWFYDDRARSIRPKFPKIPVQNRMEQKISGNSFRKFRSTSRGCPFFWKFGNSGNFLFHLAFLSGMISALVSLVVNFASTKAKDGGESTLHWMQNDLPQGAHTICLCSRLLFYSKCTRFTVCLTYSHISLTVYINQ